MNLLELRLEGYCSRADLHRQTTVGCLLEVICYFEIAPSSTVVVDVERGRLVADDTNCFSHRIKKWFSAKAHIALTFMYNKLVILHLKIF